jgi:hypothetical protein
MVALCVSKGYRVAHVLVNAASLGNCQQRKRYFFIAYDRSKNFNIEPPVLPEYRPTLFDAIWHLRHEQGDVPRLTPDEDDVIKRLPNGWCLNMFAAYNYDKLTDKQKAQWDRRGSGIPFSLHCVRRLTWTMNAPTLFSSATRFIHPDYDRPLTIKEVATIMGWDGVPEGDVSEAVPQIVKGVCPCVGTWIAQQAEHYLNDAWGSEDYYSSYCDTKSEWVGDHANGADEKVFNLNRYVTTNYRKDFPYEQFRMHRHNVDPDTGRLIQSWAAVRQSHRTNTGDTSLDWPSFHDWANSIEEHPTQS